MKFNNLENEEQTSKEEFNLDEAGQKLKESLLAYSETLDSIDKQKMIKGLALALSLHSDQKDRTDGSYVNHIMRVAERIINTFHIHDVEIILAALLHDSIEDQAAKLAKLVERVGAQEQELALAYIQEQFGEEVARIVFELTNPQEMDMDNPDFTPEEKNRRYVEHVATIIEDPKVFYVKFSEFSDNGLNIEYLQDKSLQKKFAKRYIPLYQVYIDRIGKLDIEIREDIKENLIQKIQSVKSFAESLV